MLLGSCQSAGLRGKSKPSRVRPTRVGACYRATGRSPWSIERDNQRNLLRISGGACSDVSLAPAVPRPRTSRRTTFERLGTSAIGAGRCLLGCRNSDVAEPEITRWVTEHATKLVVASSRVDASFVDAELRPGDAAHAQMLRPDHTAPEAAPTDGRSSPVSRSGVSRKPPRSMRGTRVDVRAGILATSTEPPHGPQA